MVDTVDDYDRAYDRIKVLSNLVPRAEALHYRLSRYNRYKNLEIEHFQAENYRGHMFITKPELNLSDTNIKHDSILSTLITNTDSPDPDVHDPRNTYQGNEVSQITTNSLPFSIKCNLDSRYFFNQKTNDRVQKSKLVNSHSPFIIPLYNAIEDISGFQDPILETETLPTGFHQEDLTFGLGHDRLARSYDLSLTFNEIESDYISYLILIWMLWIGLARKGIVTPYPPAIDNRYICYSCSIYRFITDSTDNKIKHWAKATGCFPKSVPYGNFFNMSSGEAYNTTTRQITIPFTSNGLEYDDPDILLDFNKLVDRYLVPKNYGRPTSTPFNSSRYGFKKLPEGEKISHLGIPFVEQNEHSYILSWLSSPSEYLELKGNDSYFGVNDPDKFDPRINVFNPNIFS